MLQGFIINTSTVWQEHSGLVKIHVKIHLLLKKKKAVMFCAIHSPLEEYDCVNWFY